MLNILRSLLFLLIVFFAVALATIRPVVANGKGAEAVKDSGSQTWNSAWGCYQSSGEWQYRLQNVKGRVDNYLFHSSGNYEVFNACTGVLEATGEWVSRGHAQIKDGIFRLYTSNGRGESESLNWDSYEHKYVYTFVDGEVKLFNFWWNGIKFDIHTA